MTILEALKSKVSYPLPDSFFQSVLIERGLSGEDEFTQSIARSKEFDLAKADVWIALVTASQVQEGNYSISLNDKSNMIKLANTIYRKYGEPEYREADAAKPTVAYRADWE